MSDLIRREDAIRVMLAYASSYSAEEAETAIRSLPAVVPGMKPLVWEDFGDWGAKASAYYQANYLIQFWKGRGQFEVALSYPGYQTGFDGERWHPTLDAAKTAAQADYEARILAALEPVAAPNLKRIGTGLYETQPAPDPAAIREAALEIWKLANSRDPDDPVFIAAILALIPKGAGK